MMRSMFAGVSGLQSHQIMMDVVGNNIANVNTVGFKSSRVMFQDALSQLLRGASASSGLVTGGVNPQQVGLGVRVGSVDSIFTQGANQLTGRSTDVSIQGDGFFIVRQGSANLYTRAGAFSFDAEGYMVDPSGTVVQGWLSENGAIQTNSPIGDIRLPVGQVVPPEATETVVLGGNLSSDTLVGAPPVSTAIEVVDSLGAAHRVSMEFVKTADNAWTMSVFDPAGNAIGTANMTFDPGTGELLTPAAPPSFTFTPTGGADPLTFNIDFGEAGAPDSITQFGGESTAAATAQNGTPKGYLRSFAISDSGVVSGVFSNGVSRELARIALATFNNAAGLQKAGQNLFNATAASGLPVTGPAGTAGRGSMAAGTLEMSNVDLAAEFTSLIIAQRGFQANSRVITVSDEMLQDLVNLKR